ncbi:hypothetical protein ACX80L_16845 [Arthrobacter sp. MDT1-48-3]|uniref:Uncharacterized protein n=1 Tax=Arthrobacter agilis TaxID=37921 RepID=A0A2L0UBN3_9MICC|nr:hypothetical protein [Arthrobacter agilis]AUZ86638.1 hypothetical protein CVO76_02530 [Arthrobacter agilis]
MIPDQTPPSRPAPHPLQGPVPGGDAGRSSRGRFGVLVLAVAFAGIGLLSLAAILVTALLQGTVWPGFVLATYFCLPIAFLLMVSLVAGSVVARRRS